MKKTNIILGIINNTEKETVPVNVDFTALSSNIEEITNMDNTKMQQISIEELQSEFNISPEWIKQVIGVKPYVNVSSSMYVIVEVTDGNTNNVINAFKEYGNKYDEMWKDYLAEEYEIVKNRQIGSKGNYVYFIVSDYSKDIIDLIK